MTAPYTVKSGDTLSGIAKKHNIKTWQEIYKHPDNAAFRHKRPNPNLIYPGDIIMIPSAGPPKPPPLPPAGPPKFEAIEKDDGFDAKATPVPWLMVPLTGSKKVRLMNAQDLTVVSVNPGIATVEDVPKCFVHGGRELIVKGRTRGTTFIEVRQPGKPAVRMEVAVKNKKTVKLTFNFVEDNSGHKTKRTASTVDGWVKDMNSILLPQANVEIKKHNVKNVKIDKNLGPVVRFSKHLTGVPASEHEWDLVTSKRDSTADLNIFFVWEYEQDINPDHDDTDAGTLDGNCIFEDEAGSEIGETLAHETGHFLGVGDFKTAGELDFLMYGTTDRRGRNIPKAHANIMNP